MRIPILIAFIVVLTTNCFGQVNAQSQKNESQQKPKSELTDADRLFIAVQKICPVSGSELGSMGEPVKVRVGEQIAFLCCEKFHDEQIDTGHWNSIQERMAEAQGICPIMENAVDSAMKSTVVNGQQIFVCCPPCIPKIQADPEPAIEKVIAQYKIFIAAERQAISDAIHAKAQKICPVSGDKLGSKGKPIKVKVGPEEHAFLCCKDCVEEEISAEHWKTIQANLAKAQRVCPVMEAPVDSSMESTVVNGRRIFVCCPPCIKKIKADPNAFIAKVDRQIENPNEESTQADAK